LEYKPSYDESNNIENGDIVPLYDQYTSSSYTNYIRVMYGTPSYTYTQPNYKQNYQNQSYNQTYGHSNYGGYNHSYQQISYGNYNRANLRSPYQSIPGSYQKSAYDKNIYSSGKRYSARSVYASYLAGGAYLYNSAKCANHYGQTPQISSQDMDSAFNYAHQQLGSYNERYGNYSGYSSQAPALKLKEKEAILMEYVSEYFAK
jgi:hypothetical protein